MDDTNSRFPPNLIMTQILKTGYPIMACYTIFHPQFATNAMVPFILTRKRIQKIIL